MDDVLPRQRERVRLRRGHRARDLGDDARAVLPHGRRRGAHPQGSAVHQVRRARAGHRVQARQDDGRVGGDREGAAASDEHRAAVEERQRAPGGDAGREGGDVAGDEDVPRHEVHAVVSARSRLGRDDERARRVRVGSRDADPGRVRAEHPRRRGRPLV